MRVLAVFAALLLATPALAADKDAAKPPKEKKVCKRNDSSASRLGGQMICKTQAEWNADRETQQRDLDKMSRSN